MQILVLPVGIYDIWSPSLMLYRELQIARTDSSTKAEERGGEVVLHLMINVSRVPESKRDDDDGTVTELFFPGTEHNGQWQCHCLTDGVTD